MKRYTFTDTFKGIIQEIDSSNLDASPRGLKVKESLLTTLPIDPTLPFPNFRNRNFNFGYFAGELAWYLKKDNNIDYISDYSGFWKNITNPGTNEINSNYGSLLFGEQLNWVVESLKSDKNSRQAIAFLNQPKFQFEGNKDWLPEIYQIGVRNPQGLTFSDYDRKIYLSNHGAKGGDWFGEAKKGENYGWKILGWGGKNYIGTSIGPKWKPGFTKAIQYWVPSIATSAITIYKGEEFKEWNGHALITSLKDQSLRKIMFNDLSNVEEVIIFKNKISRIRDIQVHPSSGKIYFLSQDSLWLMEKNHL